MSDVNTYLDAAFQETSYLEVGEFFLLRDLFKGYEWNRISRKDRLLLGTLFLNRVNKEHGFIKIAPKTSSGQQRYQISKEV